MFAAGYCLGCYATAEAPPLCSLCTSELGELRLLKAARPMRAGLHDLTALYAYQGLVRRLILRAKVQGDHQALQLLRRLTLAHPATAALYDWADAAMASPSSLWGRLRGRLDIAPQLLPPAAARRPELAPPLHLQWRWQKQALRPRHSRQPGQAAVPAWLAAISSRRLARRLSDTSALLLVDDVATTGSTLISLAQAVCAATPSAAGTKPALLIRALVFAAS